MLETQMAAPKAQAVEEIRTRPSVVWGAVLAGGIVAFATGGLLLLLGLAIANVVADPYDLTDARITGLVLGGGVWAILATALALEAGLFAAVCAMRVSHHHRGVLIGLTIWSLAFLIPGVGGAAVLADTLMTTTQATTLAMQGDEEISAADLQSATDTAREVSVKLALWGAAGLALGAAGAVAGGYLWSGSLRKQRLGTPACASRRITSLSLLTPHRWVKLDS